MAPFKYTPLQLDDKPSSSGTPDHDSEYRPPPRQRQRPSAISVLLAIVTVVTLGVCGGLVGAKVYRTRLSRQFIDPQTIFPKFPKIRRTFLEHDGQLNQPQGPLWDNILPTPGLGFISVSNPRQYDLPPSLPANKSLSPHDAPDAEVYGMAIWHQLHCLRDLRAALLYHRDGIEPTHAMVNDGHSDHCFDYLRQSFECMGDTTVEWGRLFNVDGQITGAINGYGIVHQCRDYEAIRKWTIDNRSSDRKHGEDDYERRVQHGQRRSIEYGPALT